jgi:RNA polymerase sigma factor (sigma-70 family)
VNPSHSEHDRWFSENVQPHALALRAFLRAHFPSLPDVDDMVQDCLMRVLQVHRQTPVRSPRALLYATARNLALDQLRRQKVVAFEPITETGASFVFTDDANVADSLAHKQELDLLTQAIQSLPERCRQVVTLRTAYGLSQREVAQRLGISENTVEKQMANGLRRCTEFFARHGLP